VRLPPPPSFVGDETSGYFQVDGQVVQLFSPSFSPEFTSLDKVHGLDSVQGLLLVYDITDNASYSDILEWWKVCR